MLPPRRGSTSRKEGTQRPSARGANLSSTGFAASSRLALDWSYCKPGSRLS
jgi:hypothetical protein